MRKVGGWKSGASGDHKAFEPYNMKARIRREASHMESSVGGQIKRG